MNERQKLFADEYLIDLNAEAAAIRAGYSPRYARGNAHKLVANSCIQAYIQERMAERSKRTEITQDMVLKELASIAFSNMTDYAQIVEEQAVDISSGNCIPIYDAYGKPVMQKQVDFTLTENLTEEQTRAIASIKEGRNGIEVKMHDKIRALEKLGEHLGMWKDNADTNATEDKIGKLFAAIGGALDELE